MAEYTPGLEVIIPQRCLSVWSVDTPVGPSASAVFTPSATSR